MQARNDGIAAWEPAPAHAPSNNALQLTRSHGLFHTWSRFAAPRVLARGGPSQLNAVFDGLRDHPRRAKRTARLLSPYA